MKFAPRYCAVLAGIGFLASASAASVSTNSLPLVEPSLPGAWASLLRLFGAMLVVMAIFLAAAWIFRKWLMQGPATRSPGKLRILEIRPLGHRHALYVVGYEQQRLLLASSPSGVVFLSSLPASDASEPPAVPAPNSFLEALRQVIGPSS